MKTAIGDLQDPLGRLDVKWRLGPRLAAAQGWPAPRHVVRMIMLPRHRTVQRQIATHAALFERFSLRGQAARGGLRRPRPTAAGLLFCLPAPHA